MAGRLVLELLDELWMKHVMPSRRVTALTIFVGGLGLLAPRDARSEETTRIWLPAYYDTVSNSAEPPRDSSSAANCPELPGNDLIERMHNFFRSRDEAELAGLYIDEAPSSYGMTPESVVKRTIAILPPTLFLSLARDTQLVVPILIAKKRAGSDTAPSGYYSPILIRSKKSKVQTLREAKRLILVHENSTSGYILPLIKLWTERIIPTPTPAGAKAIGWKVDEVGDHRTLCLQVSEDQDAIGATWAIPANCAAETLLRYDLVPQEVLVISSDLKSKQGAIAEFFMREVQCAASPLRSQKIDILDFAAYSGEYEIAYSDLRRRLEIVRAATGYGLVSFTGFFVSAFLTILTLRARRVKSWKQLCTALLDTTLTAITVLIAYMLRPDWILWLASFQALEIAVGLAPYALGIVVGVAFAQTSARKVSVLILAWMFPRADFLSTLGDNDEETVQATPASLSAVLLAAAEETAASLRNSQLSDGEKKSKVSVLRQRCTEFLKPDPNAQSLSEVLDNQQSTIDRKARELSDWGTVATALETWVNLRKKRSEDGA